MRIYLRPILAMLLLGTYAANAQVKPEEIKTWKMAAKVNLTGHVTVSLSRGTIVVEGTDSDSISYSFMGRGKSDQTAADWVRVAGFVVTATAEALSIVNLDTTATVPPGMTITVPRNLKQLNLKITRGGIITVRSFNGEISATNTGGEIGLEHIGGTALVNNSDGETRVIVDRLPPVGSAGLEILANNGNIILTLPESTQANMRLEASHGTIFSDFLPIQFRPGGELRPTSVHGFMTSVLPNGIILKGEWTADRPNNRMEVNPILMHSVGIPQGGAGVLIHLATINGSIIITKGGPK